MKGRHNTGELPSHAEPRQAHNKADAKSPRIRLLVRHVLLSITLFAIWTLFWHSNDVWPHQPRHLQTCTDLSCQRNLGHLVKAKNGAVASENEICSQIGVDTLKKGGNAVDAAVSTTLCIGVVNMFSYVRSKPSRVTCSLAVKVLELAVEDS